MSDFQIIAGHAGLCPVCCDGIAKGRSLIRPLAVPMPFNPAYTRFYAERGAWLVHNQYVKRLHYRTWAHQRCCDALDKRYDHEEQVALAGDWASALAEAKREACEVYGHQHGRQRRARSKAVTA